MNQSFTTIVSQEGQWYVAQCLGIDLVCQGATEDEALDNLRDALELHFTPLIATVTARGRGIEVDLRINVESKEARAKRLTGRRARTLKAFQTTFENSRR